MPEENKKAWYKRKEFWGSALTTASGLLMLFSPNTVAYKIGTGLSIIAGSGLIGQGLKTGYQSDNLPSGLTRVLDLIPDRITGVKGELLK